MAHVAHYAPQQGAHNGYVTQQGVAMGYAPAQHYAPAGQAPFPAQMALINSIRQTQEAELRTFQQMVENRVATMTAIKAMQDADQQSISSMETMLRQASNVNDQAPVSPAQHDQHNRGVGAAGTTGIGSEVAELSRSVKLLSERLAAHERASRRTK